MDNIELSVLDDLSKCTEITHSTFAAQQLITLVRDKMSHVVPRTYETWTESSEIDRGSLLRGNNKPLDVFLG
jgi:hypothetical protein